MSNNTCKTAMVKFNPWQAGWGNKGVHNFLKGIGPKVNVIAPLKFEIFYYDDTVKHFSYNAIRITPC